jgi:hypothetical protein
MKKKIVGIIFFLVGGLHCMEQQSPKEESKKSHLQPLIPKDKNEKIPEDSDDSSDEDGPGTKLLRYISSKMKPKKE